MKQIVITVIFLFAGLCLPAKSGSVREALLFKPFEQLPFKALYANTFSEASVPFEPANAAPSGDGFFSSRQLLFDGLDGDPNDEEGGTPQGGFVPASDIPWWYIVMGLFAFGWGVRARMKS
jgi:hypothetical protein